MMKDTRLSCFSVLLATEREAGNEAIYNLVRVTNCNTKLPGCGRFLGRFRREISTNDSKCKCFLHVTHVSASVTSWYYEICNYIITGAIYSILGNLPGFYPCNVYDVGAEAPLRNPFNSLNTNHAHNNFSQESLQC